jgi:hypothetical protein
MANKEAAHLGQGQVPTQVDCCDTVIGGEIYISARIENLGTYIFEALGEVRLQPARIERTAGASSAGRIWVVEASRPIRAVLSFINRCTPDPMILFCQRCKLDIGVVEKSRGYWHSLTNALIVGSPEKNLSTGEINGMEIVTDMYDISRVDAMGPKCPVVGLDIGGGIGRQ